MKNLDITIRLLDDVVVSARAATVGTHECLDHIPGSALLGVAAASFFGAWKDKRDGVDISWAWSAFHSGKVRFGNVYPLSASGVRTRPAAFSWHYPKGDKPTGGRLFNAAIAEWDAKHLGQPQQIRGGWFSPRMEWCITQHRHRLRTAIDENNFDRAKDAALFGYASLPEGSRWGATIEIDDDIPAGIREAIVERFGQGQRLRIGRSRNTEYGRAVVETVPEREADDFACSNAPAADGLVIVHALSDLALLDDKAQPSFQIDPKDLGLEDARLFAARTFVRTRVYSPFNLYRNVADLERQVIAKGSVFVFQPAATTGAPIRFTPGERRLGAYQQDGLGWVVVQPNYLIGKAPALVASAASSILEPSATRHERPDCAVAKAMFQRHAVRQVGILAMGLAHDWANRWAPYTHITSSQWARLRHEAIRAADVASLMRNLTDGASGLFAHGRMSEKWQKEAKGRSAEDVVTAALMDRKNAEHLLREARIDLSHADRLMVAACREAAILMARRKQD